MTSQDEARQPLSLTDEDLNLTFNATFNDSVQPFRVSLQHGFVNQTRVKASLTRFIDTEFQPPNDQPEYTDGPPTHAAKTIASHWANMYDWRAVEDEINSQLTQFTTIVQTPNTKYTESVPLHFVHHRSPRPDAIPLLFVHGWPGSFLEVVDIIQLLTHPPDDSTPAFHVVAPSIPGYGFSPSPRAPGFGYRQAGAAFNALMQQRLGYKRYVAQGGDAGDFIIRYAAVGFPDLGCASNHRGSYKAQRREFHARGD